MGPYDLRLLFGRLRAPVTVTLNGFTYSSTIAAMGGPPCIPLRKSNREAAGLQGDETLDVRLDLDTRPRVVAPPRDLVKALKAHPAAWAAWKDLSFSHRREYVDAVSAAKKPETRARRVAAAVKTLRARPLRKKR